MNEKLKYILIGGAIGLISYLILESLIWIIGATSSMCLSCFIIMSILDFLSLWILHLKGVLVFLTSAIFYFLVGALIGYLVHRFKK